MQYIQDIKQILAQARQKVYAALNVAMVEAYWQIGKKIVEEEQNGKQRAAYGKAIINNLSTALTAEFGKGFSERTLWDIRQFYLTFPDDHFLHTLCAELSWSHIRLIMRVNNKEAQVYYLKETVANAWSVRTLDRNISTLYYHRLIASQVKDVLEQEMLDNTKDFQKDAFEFIKNPAVLEFLNLPTHTGYTEQEFETALISNLQKFILELGKGFAFVERQQLIRTETSDFYIDLVFYNYILKCFVIIDLKTDKITHQAVGQLDMYVRMYDDLKKQASDNPTIGILLCSQTDKTIAKYSVLAENKQLFSTKYLPFLPTEEELIQEIEREKLLIKQQLDLNHSPI